MDISSFAVSAIPYYILQKNVCSFPTQQSVTGQPMHGTLQVVNLLPNIYKKKTQLLDNKL